MLIKLLMSMANVFVFLKMKFMGFYCISIILQSGRGLYAILTIKYTFYIKNELYIYI